MADFNQFEQQDSFCDGVVFFKLGERALTSAGILSPL